MACIIDAGTTLGCFEAGGIRRILIGTYDGTAIFDDSAVPGLIDAITTTSQFYIFEQEIESASLSQTVSVNRQGGTIKFSQSVAMILQGLTIETRNAFQMLSTAPLHIIVQDNNGRYWLVGEKNGARVDSADFNSGLALDDNAGASMSMLGVEAVSAKEVEASAAEGLLTP
tara:strand:+ start:3463 stop:3975 length:513 start_codon:yes stop_codon:yes gene_type:complete